MVPLVEGHLLSFAPFEQLLRTHFYHELLELLIVQHLYREDSQPEVLFLGVFPLLVGGLSYHALGDLFLHAVPPLYDVQRIVLFKVYHVCVAKLQIVGLHFLIVAAVSVGVCEVESLPGLSTRTVFPLGIT